MVVKENEQMRDWGLVGIYLLQKHLSGTEPGIWIKVGFPWPIKEVFREMNSDADCISLARQEHLSQAAQQLPRLD